MKPADKLLSCLDKVRQVKTNRWLALCPAHPDKNPSLQITETEDGTLLVKCWAGCTTAAVTRAASLEMRDLFPGNKNSNYQLPNRTAVAHERLILRLGQALLREGTELTEEDKQRFALAHNRLASLESKA
ncbi:MAG: virulence-associated protein E [Pseudomonadaceae bacterium]|nr:virulence-associated protein E [Pseudomonadaceae bacterium]